MAGSTAVLSGMVSRHILEPAMTCSGSLMTMASFCSSDFFSVTRWSRLRTCSRWGATILVVVIAHGLCFCEAHLAASFQVVLSSRCLAHWAVYGSTTSSTNCVVRPALSPSHCARDEGRGLSQAEGHFLCAFSRMQPFMLPFWLNVSFVSILNQSFKTNSFQNWSLKTLLFSFHEIFFSHI